MSHEDVEDLGDYDLMNYEGGDDDEGENQMQRWHFPDDTLLGDETERDA